MGKEFFSIADAKTKLNGCIIQWDNHPYYCTYYQDNIYQLHHLNNGDRYIRVDYRDDKFNYLTINLGYFQDGDDVKYLQRTPLRRVKQGLDADCLREARIDGNKLVSPSMLACIQGNHSTFDKALRDVKEGVRQGAAFHRHFAVRRDPAMGVSLYHRGTLIGLLKSDQFFLIDNGGSSILAKKLINMGVPVC